MRETDNLKLKMPDRTDNYNVEDFNSNFAKLDKAVSGTRQIQVTASKFTTQGPYTQRIDIAGIKSTDVPEISLLIPDGVTDSARVKAIKKAWSCIDKIETYDGYMLAKCFRKKPQQDIWLAVKGG